MTGFFNPAKTPDNVTRQSDLRIIYSRAIQSLEKDLNLAKKQRKLACAKLKKVEHTTITPRAHFRLREAYNVACQEYDAMERRVDLAKRMRGDK